jgi:hypothetical protein
MQMSLHEKRETEARAFLSSEKEVNGIPAWEYFNTPQDFWQVPCSGSNIKAYHPKKV